MSADRHLHAAPHEGDKIKASVADAGTERRDSTGRVARILIEQQPFEVSVSAPDRSLRDDPSNFPMLVDVNQDTQALEARQVHFLPLAPSPPGQDWPAGEPALHVALTTREMQVLNELAKGASNRLIGQRLGVSTGTVRVHVKSVLRKLALDNRTQAAVWLTMTDLTKDQ